MGAYNCSDGLILPIVNESDWGRGTRAILYLIGLLYSFLGVAIAADVFMCAIERITSKKRKIKIIKQTEAEEDNESVGSEIEYVEVAIWNPTVANLTLMALGSSAPEILLSIIEILGHGMKSGPLGPSTIVGSAAFNLFCISAICIAVIPSPDTRRIREVFVFIVTVSFSIFAYIWLLIILIASSPNEVEIWEAFLTLLWFVVLIVIAFMADRKFFVKKWQAKELTEDEEEEESEKGKYLDQDGIIYRFNAPGGATLAQSKQWAIIEKEVSMKYPELPPEQLAKIVASRIRASQRHDRMYYRIAATRWLDGRRSTLSDADIDYTPKQLAYSESIAGSSTSLPLKGKVTPRKCKIEFSARIFAFSGETNLIRIKVIRKGRSHKKVTVRYETASGSARKNEHFLPKSETIVFQPNETQKIITLEIIPNIQWEPEQGFFVNLHLEQADKHTIIGTCHPAIIRYNDTKDDPVVQFDRRNLALKESTGMARLSVSRISGSVDSQIKVGWSTQEVTALDGKDYDGGKGELIFEPGEVTKYIDIPIIDDMEEEKAETFEVMLNNVSHGASFGHQTQMTVTILSDDTVKEMFTQLDDMIPTLLEHWEFGASTWRQQILEATSVNDGEISDANWRDILMHIVCFPFKVIFALVPPTVLFGGWLTFFVSLILIGFLTAIVGDLASIFGCLINLRPSITAITFVALGTSLPDAFASKIAAVEEKNADSSIGNITGSNSVNVFLGLGVPWLIASIYWAAKDKPFEVRANELGFSVTIYAVFAVICVTIFLLRRLLPFFGKAELGGPAVAKYASAATLVGLWVMYVFLSTLQAYGHIAPF